MTKLTGCILNRYKFQAHKMKGTVFYILILISFFGCQSHEKHPESIRILILSGSNNHEWKKTTPFLKKIFDNAGYFQVDITNQPDTLSYHIFTKYDAVVSNWNSWPENDLRWTAEAENGLLKFVEEGGGLVFFHASTSALYNWPEFKKISTGAWGDSTWHGKKSPVQVIINNQEHPITNGLSDFYIFDELWINAEQNDSFQILGSAINDEALVKGYKSQPAIFVLKYGKGKIFHTLLGHDVRAMRNSGFQTLMLRGAEWVATSKVSLPVPEELQQSKLAKNPTFSWVENDTFLALLENDRVLWQFNFNTKHGKPFFHPIFVNKNRITCLSPDDHIWHLGQWFSWKYINDKNYWEYIGNTYQSEGITEIKNVEIIKKPDYSAEISLQIEYHPENGETVLTETRIIQISPPHENGSISMDYELSFEAVADFVDLNRTPIEGEPDGKSWGGYAGLSIRFNQDMMSSGFISSFGEDINVNGKTGDWLYMGFQGLDGTRVGSVIMISEDTRREGEAWYSVNDPEIPFYYFSPAYLYLKPQTLTKGENINLKYRIVHLEGDVTSEKLNKEYKNYINSVNNSQ